ncbi:MAG: hypothetical protein GX057_00575 [Clostridiales bacterium]|nr:hypothetical protein [Clostridiales bacterium]
MKRTICFFCAILMLSLLCACQSQDKAILSEMSEEECIEFVKSKGLEIPEELNDENLGNFIKSHFKLFEENPDQPVVISYTVAYDFAEGIRRIVKEYYNTESGQQS